MDCWQALGSPDQSLPCFLSKYQTVLTSQMVNRHLKRIKTVYQIKFSELFNHSSSMVTRRYLGLRHEEIQEVYERLTFKKSLW